MKLIGSFLIVTVFAVEAFVFPTKTFGSRARRGFIILCATTNNKEQSPFFLDSDNDDDDTTSKEPAPPKTPPPSVVSSDSTKEKLQQVGATLKKELVDPLISGKVEKNVPAHVIQGAALTGASLTLLAGQSLALTGVAGLGAAYVALSPGLGGKAVRAVGSAAWESAVAAAELYEKYGMGQKLSQATKTIVMTTVDAIQKKKNQQTGVEQEAEKIAEEEEEAVQKADLYRIAAETKKAEAAKRLAAEEEVKLAKEKDVAAKQQQDEKKRKEKEKKEAEEKRKAVTEQAKQERKEKEAKLAAEQERVQRAAEEKRKAEEVEKARLAEKMRLEDEARLKEEARKRQEARKLEEEKLMGDIAVEQDDDLEATIKLAEKILDGTIAGLDDAIADTNAKEQWDSAGRLAQDLGKGLSAKEQAQEDDDIDALSDEEDMEVLAQAAREAVAKFEEEMKNQDAAKAKQKELWDSEMVTSQDFDYDEDLEEWREEYDDEEDEDMEELQEDLSAQDFGAGDVDLDELGRQARAAVEQFESEMETEVPEDIGKAAREAVAKFNSQESDTNVREGTVTDWSKFSVAQLRAELKSRGLKTAGKKKSELVAILTTSDLVAMLTSDDFDFQVQEEATGEGIMWDSDFVEEPTMEDMEEATQDEPDMEEMARAAREAVELFEQQQANSVEVDSSMEYETMTVNELKDELRNRGLKISGKKAELIERLRSS